MPKSQTRSIISLVLFVAALPVISAETPPSLEPLQGTWSVTKTNQGGKRYFQRIEIKNDRLTFRVVEEDEQVRLVVKASVKTDKAGPFDALTLFDIQGGRTEEELQPVDDRRSSVYTLRTGKLILASNFDRERENENPSIETYTRLAVAKEPEAEGDRKLLGQWKMAVNLAETNYDYALRITKTDGKWGATMVSPRSGEHKCKSVAYQNGELVIELDRDIQGNAVTFLYKGKLAGEELSGTVVVKGQEDQFNGRWKASH